MNADIFAKWLEASGHKVLKTPSSYWVEQGPKVYQAFPYHWIIRPSKEELRELLLKERAVGLRYSTPVDALEGQISYHAILESTSYSLDMLSVNSRSKVRRGLKRCEIRQESPGQLAEAGWSLQQDTLMRQRRMGSMSQSQWRQFCLAADLPGFEVWCAYVKGEMAASILVARVDDVCYMLYPQSHRKYFGEYVNNALSYSVTHEMLSRTGIKTVFYGLRSLDAPDSIDNFKFSMGYITKPVRQRVVFHPSIAPLFNPISHALLRAAHNLVPSSGFLAKSEGLTRFYLQGKLPANEQLDIPASTNT